MALGKVTEIADNKNDNATQRIQVDVQKTEVMPENNGANITWIMESNYENGAALRIGSGSYILEYQVREVISENTGEAILLLVVKDDIEYVLKLYHKNKTPKEELLTKLNSLSSDYVIHPVATGKYNGRFFEVLPYYKDGDLLSQMPISEEQLEKIIIPCVNEGLKALHDKDIIHRDIKPENIFLGSDKSKAVIGDFGISSVLNEDVSVRATSMSRTLGYSAPETSNGFISKESDYYSFGITIYHLVLGANPFAGMSDMQILYQTINKKLEIPQTVPYRLQCLIRGLTLKDRNDRWGYEEVRRWINGESVPVREKTLISNAKRPYVFLKEEYYDLQSLSMAFANNWENAKKHLYRGLIDKYFAAFNEEMASQCMDLKEMSDKNMAVFNLIYLLNPDAPLCYKGEIYADMEDLGKRMSASIVTRDPDIVELISKGALLQFVTEHHYASQFIESIKQVTLALQSDGNSNQYFKLMYLLNPDKGFEINQVHCSDLQDVIVYLESVDNETRNRIADVLINNPVFFAWIESLGYETQISKWKDIYNKVDW